MKNFKRIMAWIALILIVGMYAFSFWAAFHDRTAGRRWFMASILTTVFAPILVYIIIRSYSIMQERRKNGVSMRDLMKMKKELKEQEKNGVKNKETKKDKKNN
jgi:ABC-type spermidine/putrescine transport system permease subunit I